MEEEDEELINFEKKLSVVLRDLSFLCKRIHNQCNKLQTEVETGKLNAESLAKLGSKTATILKSMKGNSTSAINSVHKDLVSLISRDSNYFRIFCDVQLALDKCRSNAIIEENGTYSFAELAHKETMTDLPYQTSNTDSDLSKSTETSDSSNLDQHLNNNQEINSLSLKKEHSEDTFQTEDEQWMDTLQRTNDNSKTAAVLPGSSSNTDEIGNENEDVSILVISSSEDDLEATEDTKSLRHRKSNKIPASRDDEEINQNIKNNSSENISKSFSENGKKNINKETLLDDENQDAYELETQGYNSGDNEDPYDLETEKFTSGEEDIDTASLLDESFSCHNEHSYSATRSHIETVKKASSKVRKDKESNEKINVNEAGLLSQEKKLHLNDFSDNKNKIESKTEKIFAEKEKSLNDKHQGIAECESDSESSHLSSIDYKISKENENSLTKKCSKGNKTLGIKGTLNTEDLNDPNYSSQEPSEDSDQSTSELTSQIGNTKELEIAKDIDLNSVCDTCPESENSKINDNLENTSIPDSNCLKETEKENLNDNNQENTLDSHNNFDSSSTPNDFPEDSNINENENNGEGKDQKLESSKLAPEIVSNTVNEDVNDNKQARYRYNDHDYSSSVDKDLDSDTTDIDRDVAPSASATVLVNALDNFGLETSEDAPRLSPGESVKSFEFDISSHGNIDLTENNSQSDNDAAKGPDKKIEVAINHDNQIQEMEHTSSTPEPLTKNVPVLQSDVDNFVRELEILLDDNLNKMTDSNKEELQDISEKELLDCTLEEYLSEGEEGVSQKTIIYDISSIKIENESLNIDDGDMKKETFEEFNTSKDKDIGDELLELLKEVPEVSVGDLQTEIHEIEEDSDASQKAEDILKALYEDQSEMSSTEDTDDDFNLSDSICSVVEKEGSSVNDDIKKRLKEHNMLELSISLERMEMSAKDIRKFSKENNNDIDWLCDLTNVIIKRKQAFSPGSKKTQKKRKKVFSDISSDSFSSSSEYEHDEVSSASPIHDGKLEQTLDEYLANTICRDMNSDSGEDSDDSDDSDSEKSSKKKKNLDNKNNSEKPKLSKEELEKRAWRNDPLLTGNLSDSASGRRKSKAKTRDFDTNFSVESDHLNSDSDREAEKRKKILAKFEENSISPIKRNLPDSDSSDTDSDVQFVSPIKTESNSEAGDVASPSQKGRRQIRSLLSDSDLAKETINARSEEIDRIERLKDRQGLIETLSQSFSSQQSEDEIAPLILDIDEESGTPLVQVHKKINEKLKPHQREGIKFMWDSCYESVERLKEHPGSGCILAHCMGLGKTMQVLALCHTLFSHKTTNTKHVLVVCPLSTVSNWRKETKIIFNGLKPDEQFSVFTIDGDRKNKDTVNKYDIVKTWYQRKKAILILGYEGYVNLTLEAKLEKASKNLKQRILECLVDPGPDLVICDEGHLIKNRKALKTIALYKIKTKRRIILTGTPLQNNLVEYYHMVNFVKPNLLGNIQEFKTNFVNPITNGQFEDSNELDIRLMKTRTHVLHKILLKTVQRFEEKELERYLPRMLDYAIFIQLNQVQVDLYNSFLKLTLSNPSGSDNSRTQSKFLSDFQMFQLICTHPQLMQYSEKKKNKKIEKDVITIDDDPFPLISVRGWWKDKIPADSSERFEYGTKLMVLKTILEECEAVGDKLLVFSQSLIELDLIEHFLKTIGTEKCRSWRKKIDYFRMDGTVPPHERSLICDTFNDENRKKVRLLLMSTKVGGLGLNLTAANRVVIMTVHWNPSYDTQSVFRVYRFGQKKQVFVYRLVALDTMESKVYQRQVTKLAIARRVVDKHHIMRHYKSIDLQEMYSCTPNADSERPTPNFPEDEMLAKVILKLPYIFKYHEHTALLVDTPQDKLSELELATAWEDFKNNKHTFKPPPPDPPNIPQNYSTGPTFNMAYNLGRTDLPSDINFPAFARQYYTPGNPPQVANLSTRFGQNNTTISAVTKQSPTNQVNGSLRPLPSPSTSIRKLFPLQSASTSRQIPSSSNEPPRANNLTELERNSSSNSFANRLNSNYQQMWPYPNRQHGNTRLQPPLKVNSKTSPTVQNNPQSAPGSSMTNTKLVAKENPKVNGVKKPETVQKNPAIPLPAPGSSTSKTNAKENANITVVKRPKIVQIGPSNKPNNFKTNNPIIGPSRPSVFATPGKLVKNPLHKVANNASKQNQPLVNKKSPLVIHATNSVPSLNAPLPRIPSGGIRKRIRLDNGQEHEIILKKMKHNFMSSNSIGKRSSRQENRPVEHINLDDDDDPKNPNEGVIQIL